MKNNKTTNENPLFKGSINSQEIENNILEIETPKHNFIIVYDSIYKNNNLNGYELAILIFLLSRAPTYKPNKNGLMKALHFSKEKYFNAIKGLKNKGYLKIEKIAKNEYKYIVNQAPILRTLNKDLSFNALAPLYDLHYYNELFKLGFIEEELLNELTENFYKMAHTKWTNKD